MKLRFIALIFLLAQFLAAPARIWQTDTLGLPFQVTYFSQPSDNVGPARSSLVRLLPDSACGNGKALVYIHGFNDYFFQTEMAHEFADHGYAFYAVDLRRYGRSLQDGDKRCMIRNFKDYFPDLDSAFCEISAAGYDSVVLMGHSTGGLLASYYMAVSPSQQVRMMILNSPFLDWNLGSKECLIGLVSSLGRLFPDISFSSGSSTAYGESLLKGKHGEWNFNTDWKSIEPTKVNLGWVRAVTSAQRWLRSHPDCIDVPILLLYSSGSVNLGEWTPEAQSADAVLDVADIRSLGMRPSDDVTAFKVNGGIHDLFLSSAPVREQLYQRVFDWLGEEWRKQ